MESIKEFRHRVPGRGLVVIALVTAGFVLLGGAWASVPAVSGQPTGSTMGTASPGLGMVAAWADLGPPPAPPPPSSSLGPPRAGWAGPEPAAPAESAISLRPTTPAADPRPFEPAERAAAGLPSAVRQARLSWPLSPVPVVTKYFDAPETPYGPGHRGVDLAAIPGQEVLAADAGVVVFAGLVAGRPVLSVDHDGGLRTTYEPVEPKVAVGEQVYRGQVLGTVLAGHPGCAIAACLHWGVRRGDEYVDPLALTGEVGEFRLKPWGGGP
jgi:hypothetical protein